LRANVVGFEHETFRTGVWYIIQRPQSPSSRRATDMLPFCHGVLYEVQKLFWLLALKLCSFVKTQHTQHKGTMRSDLLTCCCIYCTRSYMVHNYPEPLCLQSEQRR